MEKVNVRIDGELGIELKKYLDQGYAILGVEMLKGFKQDPDIYFISLGEKQAAIIPVISSGAVVGVSPKEKIKEGQAESAEQSEPFHFVKPVVAAHSSDPTKPTLADLVDRIISAHKKTGLNGKSLADRCLTDVMEMKDPVTQKALASDVQAAIQAYLNYELSK